MVLEGIRSRLRSIAESGSDAARETPEKVREARARTLRARARAGGAVAKAAPGTDLERNRNPSAPTQRQLIAQRLNDAGQMRKPIGDANLEPGADPRFVEAFARGDATTGEWFGESEAPADPFTSEFARGDDMGMEFGPFVNEMLDERDHEAGHYAYDDEHETGALDDGVDLTNFSGVAFRW